MPRTPFPLLLAAAATAACGSEPGSRLGNDAGTGTTLHFGPCTAALQPGAPTPMSGYCPTGAGLTAGAAPRNPSVAWTRTLVPNENPENYLPFDIVVDASGRAYVGVYSSPNNRAPRYEIVAVDSDGTFAWTMPVSTSPNGSGSACRTPPTGLVIGRDGTIWGLTDQSAYYANGCFDPAGGTPTVLLGLGRDGSVARRITVTAPPGLVDAGAQQPCGDFQCGPPDASFDNGPAPADFAVASVDNLAMGSDGSFFVLSDPYGIARVRPDGSTAWAWSSAYFAALAPLYLTPSDDVVATASSGLNADAPPALLSLTAEGASGWLADASSIQILDPGGNPVGVSQTLPSGEITLTRLDTSGNVKMRASLGAPMVLFEATHLAVASDGTILVLLAYESPTPGDTATQVQLLAVDPGTGATRWTSTFDFRLPFTPSGPAAHFGLFVDPSGTIVLSAGAVRGIDLATGSTVWTVQPPHPAVCLQPAVLGVNGSIIAAQCDGSVFLARDP